MNENSIGSCSQDSSVRPHACHCDSGFCFENMMAKMEGSLTCPVCRGLYENPKVLSCAHSLCGHCLAGVVQGNGTDTGSAPSSIKCPVCHMEMGIDKPKDNFLLKAIVEKYIKIRKAPKPPLCPLHCEQPLNIFCSTDKKLICGFCATSEEHKEHVLTSIEDAFKQEKTSLMELRQGLERGRDALSHLETRQAQALQGISDESDIVKAYFENLQYILEQKKNQILSDLKNRNDVVKQGYQPEIDKLKVMLEEEKRALDMAKDLGEVADPVLFLQKIHQVRTNVTYVKDLPLPTVADTPATTSLTNINTSAWDNTTLADVDKLCWPPKYPEKKQEMKTPFSFWVVCVGILLLALIVAAFFSGSSDDRLLISYDSALPVSSNPSDGAGMNTGNISLYKRMIADAIVHVGEKCWDKIKGLVEQVGEFVSTFTFTKSQGKKIPLLDMEEERALAPSISEPTKSLTTREKQTGICARNP